jgi:hypothetical protein
MEDVLGCRRGSSESGADSMPSIRWQSPAKGEEKRDQQI